MKDPTPWQDATELERQLLDAGRRDLVPAAIQSRMAEALSVLPPLAAPATAAQTAGFARGGSWFSHPGLWGSLSAAILAGAVGWRAVSHRDAPVARDRATAPETAGVPTATPTTATIENVDPIEPAPSVAPALASVAVASAPAPGAAEPTLHLREELALLDAARTALASREPARALQLLDRHAAQFTHGSLAPEADALRIDAWMQRGSTERAERLSRRFLERYPTHPLAAHIASVAKDRAE